MKLETARDGDFSARASGCTVTTSVRGPPEGVTRNLKSEPDSPGPPGPAFSKVPARVTIMIILPVSFIIRRLIKKSKPDSALGPAFSKIPARVTT